MPSKFTLHKNLPQNLPNNLTGAESTGAESTFGISVEQNYSNKSDDQWAADVLKYKYAVPPCNDTCADQYKQEAALEAALVSVAPISVCMDASPWMLYQSFASSRSKLPREPTCAF